MTSQSSGYASSFQKGEKLPQVHKLLNMFKSRRGAGWTCLALALAFQIGAVIWIASDLKTVGDKTEAVSSYILGNLSTQTLGSPSCTLDYAFQSEAQPPLVRKSEFNPILIKVILLASSTILCVIGLTILSKNPFQPS